MTKQEDETPDAQAAPPAGTQAKLLGRPRVHLRSTTSTNDRARELALAGAPHGTLVTAAEQTAGRGRQGRRWTAPAGSSLLMSLVLRDAPSPLPLIAAVAVCDAVGDVAGKRTRVKWPNDVVVEDQTSANRPVLRKLAGILIEGRPQEGWAVLGIGVNVAVDLSEMPVELRETAASLGMTPRAIEPTLTKLLSALERRLEDPTTVTLNAWRTLDALYRREVLWMVGETPHKGQSDGIDNLGRLIVVQPEGQTTALEAGEVTYLPTAAASES